MHIEPGVVTGAKLALSVVTAAGSLALAGKLALKTIRHDGGLAALAGRSAIATGLVFAFFEVLPSYPVGVSEVHFILGTTLYLLFGGGAAAIGLALGLLAQGVFLAPADLPHYAMNLTTLIVPLFLVAQVAGRIIPANTAYVDITYKQALTLSATYQGGIVAWVAFWAFYGQGFGAENLTQVASFGGAYMVVLILEPLADLAVLAIAKAVHDGSTTTPLLQRRLSNPA